MCDLRNSGAILLANPSNYSMLDYPGQTPAEALENLDSSNVIDVAKQLAAHYSLTVGISNWTINEILRKGTVEYQSILLDAIGHNSSIDRLCSELARAKEDGTNPLGSFKTKHPPSDWSPYKRTAILYPTSFFGLGQKPIKIDLYREDLLKKIKD